MVGSDFVEMVESIQLILYAVQHVQDSILLHDNNFWGTMPPVICELGPAALSAVKGATQGLPVQTTVVHNANKTLDIL
jgi:hypothetical protein